MYRLLKKKLYKGLPNDSWKIIKGLSYLSLLFGWEDMQSGNMSRDMRSFLTQIMSLTLHVFANISQSFHIINN